MMGAFVEIGRVNTSEQRSIAISRRGDGLYSLAQVVMMLGDEGKPMSVYFKGAFTLSGEGLLKIRNLINDLFDDNGDEKSKANFSPPEK